MINNFGWRGFDKHDERDYPYIPKIGYQALPDLWSNKERFVESVGLPFNQTNLGSCGAWTAKENIIYDDLQDGAWFPPSAIFIYYNARMEMGMQYVNQDSGVTNRELCNSLKKYGACHISLWPDDNSKFTVKPSVEAYADGLKRAIKSYSRVNQTMEDIKACIAGGDTFILGFKVYPSYKQAAQNGGLFPDPQPGEQAIGGHDVTAVGYDSEGVFILNHWGLWGNKGFGKMSWNYILNRNAAGDFWVIDAGNPTVVVDPNPPPNPQPTGKIEIWVDNIQKVQIPGYRVIKI